MDMGKIIIIIGASGSGKSTVGKALEREYGIKQLVSYTSRPMRDGEVYGVDYYFLDRQMAKYNKIISVETTVYDGNIYGLTIDEVESKRKDGNDVYFISDRDGAEEIQEWYSDEEIIVLWFDISPWTMLTRMFKRGDSLIKALKRVIHAYRKGEFNQPQGSYRVDANEYIDAKEIYNIINHEINNIEFTKQKEKTK